MTKLFCFLLFCFVWKTCAKTIVWNGNGKLLAPQGSGLLSPAIRTGWTSNYVTGARACVTTEKFRKATRENDYGNSVITLLDETGRIIQRIEFKSSQIVNNEYCYVFVAEDIANAYQNQNFPGKILVWFEVRSIDSAVSGKPLGLKYSIRSASYLAKKIGEIKLIGGDHKLHEVVCTVLNCDVVVSPANSATLYRAPEGEGGSGILKGSLSVFSFLCGRSCPKTFIVSGGNPTTKFTTKPTAKSTTKSSTKATTTSTTHLDSREECWKRHGYRIVESSRECGGLLSQTY